MKAILAASAFLLATIAGGCTQKPIRAEDSASQSSVSATTGMELVARNEGLPVVTRLEAGGAAAKAGVMVGDTLIRVNGQDPFAAKMFVGATPGKRYTLQFKRGAEVVQVVLVAEPLRETATTP